MGLWKTEEIDYIVATKIPVPDNKNLYFDSTFRKFLLDFLFDCLRM